MRFLHLLIILSHDVQVFFTIKNHLCLHLDGIALGLDKGSRTVSELNVYKLIKT